MKTSTSLFKGLYYSVGIAFIVLFWLILSSVKDSFVYPTFDLIFQSIGEILVDKTILFSALMSLLRVIIVIIISFIISTIITFLYLWKKETFYLFKPLLIILKSAPLAIISVYLWISLGAESAPYLITLLMVLPVSIEGFITSVDEIDKSYLTALKLENIKFYKKFFKIYLPLIRPYIFMTFLQTFGMGIKVMLMGEYICQTSSSLGQIIYIYKQDLSFSHLIALLIVISLLVAVIEIVINRFSTKIAQKY